VFRPADLNQAPVLDLAPASEAGSQDFGAQLLLERMSGKANEHARRITLQTDLIVRKSCCIDIGVPRR
jgi:LacI family transcriptional regulator